MTKLFTGLCSLALILSLRGISLADSDRPLVNPKFDPAAKQVELFSAMEEGTIEVKLVPKDSTGGSLFVANKTKEPLTVQMPAGFAAVPISAQFGGGMGGMGGGMGGMGGGMGGMGGQQQSMGGGMGGGMGGMGGGMGGMGGGMGGMGGGMGGMGGGFFSIPAEKTVRVPFTSVCLNHGLNEPTPRTKYTVMPVDKYTKDPVLQSLIFMVGTGKLDQHSAQAATWHITDNMSWQQLAQKGKGPVRVPGDNYFSAANIQAAIQIAGMAQSQAAERIANDPSLAQPVKTGPIRTLRPLSTR